MSELERFKTNINLVDFVYSHGFTEIDGRKSSRACTVLRRGPDKIGVSKSISNNHWIYFDIRIETGGSIIDFVQNETGKNLGEVRITLRKWLGISPKIKSKIKLYRTPTCSEPNRLKVAAEFEKTKIVIRRHTFLESRKIEASTYLSDRFYGSIYKDRYKNAIFPHYDQEGLCGLEKRNTKFWGFSAAGKKGLWFSRSKPGDRRFVFGESAIDMLSYFQLRDDGYSRYFSFSGNLSDDIQIPLLVKLADINPGIEFILAVDNDQPGLKLIQKIKMRCPSVKFSEDLPKNGFDWAKML